MKKIVKSFLSIILVFTILFGAVPLSGFKGVGSSLWNGFCPIAVSAKEEVEDIIETLTPVNVSDNTLASSGKCGDNVYWSFNSSTGALTISGTGNMYSYIIEAYPDYKPQTYGPFYNNTSIKSVTIEPGVTSIFWRAFDGCSSLTSVTIPDSVTSISGDAFCRCSSLTSVTIGNKVKRIGDFAFYYCSSLKTITIPDSVTSIGEDAFCGCSKLSSIVIPNSVTSIGRYAFCNCSSLTSITIPFVGEKSDGTGKTHFGHIFGASSYDDIYYKTYVPSSLKNVTITGGKSIGENAFYKCSNLTSIVISNSVTSIGADAFEYCSSLTSVTIPNSVTSIGSGAFYNCSNLTSINIPNSVTSIGGGAFIGCYSLIGVYISDINAWAQISFYNELANPLCYARELYVNNKLINGDIILSDNVKSIGISAFNGCNKITSVTIPNSVTSIGGYAFSHCSSLTSVTIPDSVTNIGDYAFNMCNKLTIKCSRDSYGYKYAIANDIPCMIIGNGDSTAPTGSISTTNNVAASQTVTLSMSDNVGVAGYYWGISSTYTNNTYTATSISSVTKTISSAGTYYLTVKDTTGNVSTNYSITFYKTTLNANGGSVSPTSVLTKSGNSFTFPTPTRSSYTYSGWSTSSSATSGIKTLEPTSNSTYYAMWTSKQNTKVKSVFIDDISLNYKSSVTITPTITADEGANYDVTYKSSNPTVAIVDDNGKVTSVKQSGLNRGSTVITCTVKDSNGNVVTDTCTVTVQFTWWQWIIKIVLFGWIWY